MSAPEGGGGPRAAAEGQVSEAGMVAGEIPSTPPPEGSETPASAFSSPDKITSVVRAVLARPSADSRVSMLLGVLTSPLGRRLVVRPMLALLPPLDAPDEWDAWLRILSGCALELASDGVEIDVDAARHDARLLLAELFAEPPG